MNLIIWVLVFVVVVVFKVTIGKSAGERVIFLVNRIGDYKKKCRST